MKTLSLLTFILLASPMAFANEADDAFTQMDEDGNGMLDRQEAQADPNLQVYFGRADTDASGAVSLTEYQIFTADLARASEDVPAE